MSTHTAAHPHTHMHTVHMLIPHYYLSTPLHPIITVSLHPHTARSLHHTTASLHPHSKHSQCSQSHISALMGSVSKLPLMTTWIHCHMPTRRRRLTHSLTVTTTARLMVSPKYPTAPPGHPHIRYWPVGPRPGHTCGLAGSTAPTGP